MAEFSGRLVLGSKRLSDVNQVMIALATSVEDVLLAKPCCTIVEDKDIKSIKRGVLPAHMFTREQRESCHILYVVVPRFASPSDAIYIVETFSAAAMAGKQLVFVTVNASAWVRRYLVDKFPGSRAFDVESW
jgi:hypothetical protein